MEEFLGIENKNKIKIKKNKYMMHGLLEQYLKEGLSILRL